MPTFLVLLISMQCLMLAQRQARGGQARGMLMALGVAGLGAGFALSAHANGVERGAAAWLACLMAAGLLAPFLASHIPRLESAVQWSQVRVLLPLAQRLQASFK